ncbi:prepilin peptidase [Pseudomonas stutzeri]|nr:prepilin peptidase [Stutzerimonas stutzeri]
MLIALISALLLGAVIYDVVSHRLPNYYLLLIAVAGFSGQVWLAGTGGALSAGGGLLTGLALFLPFYVLGGMAAGDVKLMAAVGTFLGAATTLWAAAYTLMFGAAIGIVYLVYRGQFGNLLVRYWAMAATRSRISAADGDAARHRFPYALAIAAGTMTSLYWTPL